MRVRTRSGGKPKTPMRTLEKMTRTVTLSRARPRKPLTSPAASQRGARPGLAGAGVGDSGAEGRLPLRARALGQRRAPGERSAMLGDVLVVELQGLAHPAAHVDTRAIRAARGRVTALQAGL